MKGFDFVGYSLDATFITVSLSELEKMAARLRADATSTVPHSCLRQGAVEISKAKLQSQHAEMDHQASKAKMQSQDAEIQRLQGCIVDLHAKVADLEALNELSDLMADLAKENALGQSDTSSQDRCPP